MVVIEERVDQTCDVTTFTALVHPTTTTTTAMPSYPSERVVNIYVNGLTRRNGFYSTSFEVKELGTVVR
jgi:hypothetical protein